ncbi:MAG: PKD domain-containing protein [Alphaproteobacteria bacterium]|nr:PKD domain-containing protein [Alphaproteobacteria bacterium]
MTSLLALVALASNPAHAWRHTTFVWNREDFPVQWYMAGGGETDLGFDYAEQAMQESVANWPVAAPCAQLESEYMGVREGVWAGGVASEGIPTMYMDDPAEQNGDSALGVTYSVSTGEYAFDLADPVDEGVTNVYTFTRDSDIVLSEWVNWVSPEDVEAGACSNGYTIQSVATHEFGHWWGLGHSCEEDEVADGNCSATDLLEATMFWSGSPCDNAPSTPKTDDITSINFLYGPYATFSLDPDTDSYGGVPLEVCFDLETKGVNDDELVVTWNFGDGETSNEFSPCHTYTTKGQYTVFITVSGDSAECGDFSYDFREPALVLACEAPQAAEGFEGMFTVDYVDGTTYQMVNQADTSVYGCIDRVQWDVFKGGELVQSIGAWSPKIDFGAEGTYDIVLNLGGPGGIAAETLTVDVGSEKGGCSAVPAAAGLLGMFAGLGAALGRRRRRA